MNPQLYEYLLGTFILSLVHGSIPNHWLPFIAISKGENWNFKKLAMVVLGGGIFHSLSTSLLGFFISYLGFHSFQYVQELEKILPTFFMVFLGMIYMVLDSHEDSIDLTKLKKRKLWLTIGILYITMFFSPCLEIEVIYFGIGKFGFFYVFLISILYTIITILSMLFFTFISFKDGIIFTPEY